MTRFKLFRFLLPLAISGGLTLGLMAAPAEAKKINLPPADVQLTGGITAGPKQARDVIWKTVKRSPKLGVTVFNLPITFGFGINNIPFGDKCFDTTDGVPEAWSGFNLFSDGTVTLPCLFLKGRPRGSAEGFAPRGPTRRPCWSG